MPSKEILDTHPIASLKREIRKTNITGYSKLTKDEIINIMLKNKDRFHHIVKYVKPERKPRVKKPKVEKTPEENKIKKLTDEIKKSRDNIENLDLGELNTLTKKYMEFKDLVGLNNKTFKGIVKLIFKRQNDLTPEEDMKMKATKKTKIQQPKQMPKIIKPKEKRQPLTNAKVIKAEPKEEPKKKESKDEKKINYILKNMDIKKKEKDLPKDIQDMLEKYIQDDDSDNYRVGTKLEFIANWGEKSIQFPTVKEYNQYIKGQILSNIYGYKYNPKKDENKKKEEPKKKEPKKKAEPTKLKEISKPLEDAWEVFMGEKAGSFGKKLSVQKEQLEELKELEKTFSNYEKERKNTENSAKDQLNAISEQNDILDDVRFETDANPSMLKVYKKFAPTIFKTVTKRMKDEEESV